MPLLSLALDSAVGSRVNSSVAHPGTARQWYRVLYSPHKRNKQWSTTREHPMAYVNIQQARSVVGSPRRCITDIPV